MAQVLSRAARNIPLALSALLISCLAPHARAEEARSSPSESTGARALSLAEVLAHAERHAPAIVIASLRRGEADAARVAASAPLHSNPNFTLYIGPRFEDGGRGVDFQASIAQPVELAGTQGQRRTAAERLSERRTAELHATRWELRRDLVGAFYEALVAEERVRVDEQAVRLMGQLLVLARRRKEAGDASLIDVRIAQTELAQAEQAKLRAIAEQQSARIELAELAGLSIESPPHVEGSLEAAQPIPPLALALKLSRAQHPELRARRAAVTEAKARTDTADRSAYPTPVFGAQVVREGSPGGAAHIFFGTVSVDLPLWQRNQGQRAELRVERQLLEAAAHGAERALEARVARAHSELTAARARIDLYTSSVAPEFESSLALLQRGAQAGELPPLEVAVSHARLLRAKHDALDAYLDYYLALAELEFALGSQLVPGTPGPMAARGAP